MCDDYGAVVAGAHSFVVEREGSIIGLLVLVERADGLLLDNVAVDPAHQRRGLGDRLLTFAEGEARRLGYPALDLYTHAAMTENLAWYRRRAYRVHRRVRERGYDRVYMRKELG